MVEGLVMGDEVGGGNTSLMTVSRLGDLKGVERGLARVVRMWERTSELERVADWGFRI